MKNLEKILWHFVWGFFGILLFFKSSAQSISVIDSFRIYSDIKITIDKPATYSIKKKTIIIFYALPNGNTTAQTMGKIIKEGDDWHYDIQHINAQTNFIRAQDTKTNYLVYYLENDFKSWPMWKKTHPDFSYLVPKIVDSLYAQVVAKHKVIYLNGHSGGGSFIFSYLSGVKNIPAYIKRISFIDSDYGYDSTYYPKFLKWLKNIKHTALNVFAYNDSLALYNGKPIVSATGGTWVKSHLFLKDLQKNFKFCYSTTDSIDWVKTNDSRIYFFFKKNLNRGIYHTQQVAQNGFIHSIFCGTKFDSKKYKYYAERAYNVFIE